MTVGALRDTRRVERRQRSNLTLAHLALRVVTVAVTVVFLWSVWAFLGAILWSVVAAIMFWPLNNRILARRERLRMAGIGASRQCTASCAPGLTIPLNERSCIKKPSSGLDGYPRAICETSMRLIAIEEHVLPHTVRKTTFRDSF